MTTEVHPELHVDTSRNERLRINVDITFPRLPCAYLSLDAMDVSGEHELDVDHGIFKKRLNPDGTPAGEIAEVRSLGDKDVEIPMKSPGCGTCYGAEKDKNTCCNTCEEVQDAYRARGWAFTNPEEIAQCIQEGFSEKMRLQRNEGCQVYGYILVKKVAGNFHIAPGKSFQQHHMHVHDLKPYGADSFNLSHRIDRLSFGNDFPGIINPLDGVSKSSDDKFASMYQYFLKVVPTTYEKLDGAFINTNQFSVTENYKPIQSAKGGHGLPGVFFMYDLSPIKIQYTERQKSFGHFLTGVCAIVGGVFTVAGIIDSFLFHGLRAMKKKQELGKFG